VVDGIVGARRGARRWLPHAAAVVATLLAGVLLWTWLASRGGREVTTAVRDASGAAPAASRGTPTFDTSPFPGGGIVIDDTFLEERRLGIDEQPFFGHSAYCRTAYRPDGFLIEARGDLPCQYVIYSTEFLPDPGIVSVSMRLMRHATDSGRGEYGLGAAMWRCISGAAACRSC
jgi:hypothetical protein